jgi:hypothetical protein
MARIRTIKPEFPQSESIGGLSRDARLLFIQLFTIADDSGRSRAASRMLASLLYPYDDDAKDLIGVWLTELESMGMIVRYVVDGDTYLEIANWLKHQKIDKPSPSKIPPISEGSLILSKPREDSKKNAADMDLDLVPGREKEKEANASSKKNSPKPTRLPQDWQPNPDDVKYAKDRGLNLSRVAEDFRGYWLAKAKDNTKLDWSLTWQGWCRRESDKAGTKPENKVSASHDPWKTGMLVI